MLYEALYDVKKKKSRRAERPALVGGYATFERRQPKSTTEPNPKTSMGRADGSGTETGFEMVFVVPPPPPPPPPAGGALCPKPAQEVPASKTMPHNSKPSLYFILPPLRKDKSRRMV
jgi:hypothetical protein